MRCRKQNTVARLKSNILLPKFFASPQNRHLHISVLARREIAQIFWKMFASYDFFSSAISVLEFSPVSLEKRKLCKHLAIHVT